VMNVRDTTDASDLRCQWVDKWWRLLQIVRVSGDTRFEICA
jgi:hypothetical protein